MECEEGAVKRANLHHDCCEKTKELEALLSEKPRIQPPIPGPLAERFQRIWEACLGLQDKADFKILFNYAQEIEEKLVICREVLVRIKNVRATECCSDEALPKIEDWAQKTLEKTAPKA